MCGRGTSNERVVVYLLRGDLAKDSAKALPGQYNNGLLKLVVAEIAAAVGIELL